MESEQVIRAQRKAFPLLQSNPVAKYLGLGVLIVGCGLLGEFLLLHDPTSALALVFLGVAILLGAALFPGVAVPRSPAGDVIQAASSITSRSLALRLVGVGAAVLLWVASLFAWWADPSAVFGLQGVLWLAGIGALVASCIRWPSVAVAQNEPAWSRTEVLVFSGILALALFTYLASLDTIPWRFHYDEALAYIETMRFFRGPPISVFSTTWSGTSLPSMWFVVPAALMHLVGTGLAGVRSGVALAGALTVLPVYGLARLLGGRTAAVIAAFAWAVSPVAIQYSRISIINMTTGLAWAVCFYFLLKGLRSRSPADFMWAGLAAGLSMYTYYGTRLLPYVLVAFVLYLLVFHFSTFKATMGWFALVPVGFLVGFGPLLAYFIRNPDMWAGRGLSQLNVPSTLPTTLDSFSVDWNALAPLAWRNFLGLSALGSNDGCYWGSFFSPLWAVLFLVGVGVLLRRWRDPAAALIMIWGTGVLFVGGTLIAERFIPDYAHWTPAFPAFFVALSLPPALWLRSLGTPNSRFWVVGCGLVAAGAIAQAAADGYWYLNVYPLHVPQSYEDAEGRLLATLSPADRALFVGNSWQPLYSAIADMMAPGVHASDLLNPSRSFPLEAGEGHNLVFVFNDDEIQYLPLVQSYYPGGQVAPIPAPVGKAYTYRVAASQVEGRYGVLLTLWKASGVSWQGRVSKVGEIPTGIEVGFPVTATWSGLFLAREGSSVTLGGPTNAELWVQGERVDGSKPVRLEQGWVPFAVRAGVSSADTPKLLIQEGQKQTGEAPTARLWPQPPGEGLAVTVAHDGVTMSRRIDPYVGSGIWGTGSGTLGGILPPPAERDPLFIPLAPDNATLVRWQGELYTDGGTYTINLRSDGLASMEIDGRTVLRLCTPRNVYPPKGGDLGHNVKLPLAKGWHSIELSLSTGGNDNGLELSWIRPGGVHEIIPPSRFRFALDPVLDASVRWPPPQGAPECPAK